MLKTKSHANLTHDKGYRKQSQGAFKVSFRSTANEVGELPAYLGDPLLADLLMIIH